MLGPRKPGEPPRSDQNLPKPHYVVPTYTRVAGRVAGLLPPLVTYRTPDCHCMERTIILVTIMLDVSFTVFTDVGGVA